MPLPHVTLASLREFPVFLRHATRGLTDAEWRARPAGAAESILDIACHLRDYDAGGFRWRMDRMLAEADPSFADFDTAGARRAGDYAAQDPLQVLAAFEASRSRAADELAGMPDPQLNRPGRMLSTGPISPRVLVDMVLEHDAGHRAEIVGPLARLGKPVETFRTIVAALIRNSAGAYLLCRMPEGRGVFPGQWGLPGGGMEPGELTEEALRREVLEEVGLDLVSLRPVMFYDDHRVKRMGDGTEQHVYMIYLVFECLAAQGSGAPAGGLRGGALPGGGVPRPGPGRRQPAA